ncbi:hypothetical protein BRC62_01185, partial [Halobacteriales archaeon QH_10_67_13]
MTASGAELTEQRLSERRLSDRLRRGGVSGAGGAGFPTYAKWEHLEKVEYLMVNHQESEPVYTGDKWLGRARPEKLAALFEWLLAEHLEAVVVSAKAGDREHSTDRGWLVQNTETLYNVY